MARVNARPIVCGILVGAIVGALVGLMVSSRRAKGGRASVDAKAIAGVGFTIVTLAKQIIDIFSQ